MVKESFRPRAGAAEAYDHPLACLGTDLRPVLAVAVGDSGSTPSAAAAHWRGSQGAFQRRRCSRLAVGWGVAGHLRHSHGR